MVFITLLHIHPPNRLNRIEPLDFIVAKFIGSTLNLSTPSVSYYIVDLTYLLLLT